MRFPRTAPTATHLEVHQLIEDHLAVLTTGIGHQIFEVDSTFPIHVPVAGSRLSIARSAISIALHINSIFVAKQIVVIGGHTYHRHGQVAIGVVHQIGTGHHFAGQFASLEETETTNRGRSQ